MVPFRRAYRYLFQKKRYLLFKETNQREVDQWARGGGQIIGTPKMTTIDLIRLPVDYKPAPIRHKILAWIDGRSGLAYPELQLPGRITHPAIAPIVKDIITKLNNHFGTYYETDKKTDTRNSLVMLRVIQA